MKGNQRKSKNKKNKMFTVTNIEGLSLNTFKHTCTWYDASKQTPLDVLKFKKSNYFDTDTSKYISVCLVTKTNHIVNAEYVCDENKYEAHILGVKILPDNIFAFCFLGENAPVT